MLKTQLATALAYDNILNMITRYEHLCPKNALLNPYNLLFFTLFECHALYWFMNGLNPKTLIRGLICLQKFSYMLKYFWKSNSGHDILEIEEDFNFKKVIWHFKTFSFSLKWNCQIRNCIKLNMFTWTCEKNPSNFHVFATKIVLLKWSNLRKIQACDIFQFSFKFSPPNYVDISKVRTYFCNYLHFSIEEVRFAQKWAKISQNFTRDYKSQ